EVSPGKDSTTGHWELGGLVLNNPFPTYPNGFPKEIIEEFTKQTGYGVIGNKAASGTEIIKELGEEHLTTGKLIVYTSADSVFQIAANDSLIPLEELYRLCEISRKFLKGKHEIARVIARPFKGTNKENFTRTKYRKDYSLKPIGKTILTTLKENNIPTVAIGKISDLYAYEGISESVMTKSNEEGMNALLDSLTEYKNGLIMANLVDFDMLWGHRNDPDGFKQGLEIFDIWLAQFISNLDENDMLILTADHGNDPTTPSTDHSREYVPILCYGHLLKSGVNMGVRKTFADLQASLAEYFSVSKTVHGESFMPLIYT
ncbi:MAG: phosphopentomutase, partial [Calditrichia bacterium]|nr:phosphopentomutase [Calditrichia bacterium]